MSDHHSYSDCIFVYLHPLSAGGETIRLLNRFRGSYISFSGFLFLRSPPPSLLNSARLAGPSYATEKPSEVPRQPHKENRGRFDRQSVFW